MSITSKRPSIVTPSTQEDKAITAAARGDPDAKPLTPKQLKAMLPMRALRGLRDAPFAQGIARGRRYDSR